METPAHIVQAMFKSIGQPKQTDIHLKRTKKHFL